MLTKCSINFSVGWITLPHSGHVFLQIFLRSISWPHLSHSKVFFLMIQFYVLWGYFIIKWRHWLKSHIPKIWQQLSLFILWTKLSIFYRCVVSNSCILSICSVNILVVWITFPHTGHGFFKYFKTKLVYHKYHIPFSSSNQDVD